MNGPDGVPLWIPSLEIVVAGALSTAAHPGGARDFVAGMSRNWSEGKVPVVRALTVSTARARAGEVRPSFPESAVAVGLRGVLALLHTGIRGPASPGFLDAAFTHA